MRLNNLFTNAQNRRDLVPQLAQPNLLLNRGSLGLLPEQLVPCGSEVCRKCTEGYTAHFGLLSAPGWRGLNEYGAPEKLEYWWIYSQTAEALWD